MPTSKQNDSATSEVQVENQLDGQKFCDAHRQNFLYSVCTLAGFALLSIWIMQNSVNAYYQQTYHRESPITALDQWSWWKAGGKIGEQLYAQLAGFTGFIQQRNEEVVKNFNQDHAYTAEYKAYLAEKARLEKIRLAKEAQARAQQAILDRFTLTKQDQVFFAGDSLMQGVAPHVQQYLQEKYEIKTVNLSKQSTGLSYPKFFDWPQTIADTLKNNANIKVLVVFLGPNDPWDMPNPEGGMYLRFKSPEWEAIYRSRIANIIQSAQKHQVSVMWISPPNMKKDSLNQQMIYLNGLVKSEVQKHKEFFVDSRPLLGGKGDIYNDYLIKDEKSIKMRSADGIHFSPDGQREIAGVILRNFKFVE